MIGLEGKNALVTGAGRGIGEATARKLASCGARVLVNDLDADVAEEVAASIPGGVAHPADLTDPGAADQVVQAAIDAFGGLDIVVNNAGYIWHSAIHNMSDEQWNAMIDIHATAQFRILRAYGRWLRGNRGPDSSTRKVVNISSQIDLVLLSVTSVAATPLSKSPTPLKSASEPPRTHCDRSLLTASGLS